MPIRQENGELTVEPILYIDGKQATEKQLVVDEKKPSN